MKDHGWRMLVEVAFIVFLFYANLLMGEYERSGPGLKNGLAWALGEIFTIPNFGIAAIAAVIGFALFEYLRTR